MKTVKFTRYLSKNAELAYVSLAMEKEEKMYKNVQNARVKEE